jgi:hypothetical protein
MLRVYSVLYLERLWKPTISPISPLLQQVQSTHSTSVSYGAIAQEEQEQENTATVTRQIVDADKNVQEVFEVEEEQEGMLKNIYDQQ